MMQLNPATSSTAIPRSQAAIERSFQTHDGTPIFYRCWPALEKAKGAIVLLHRGHEHGGRMAHLVDELDMPDFAFYAWDARGHGMSPGERGHSPSFAASIRDLDSFIGEIEAIDGIAVEDMAVVAQSVGAVLAASWAHDYAPRLRAMVLASPAFDVKLYVPFARQMIGLWQRLRGPFFVNSYVKARLLTHDESRIADFENDPSIARPIASNILLELHETARRVVDDAAAITIPTQLLVSGSDWVVRQQPQHEFFVRLGSETKERHVLPGFFHDTLGERDRADVVEKMLRFLSARFDQPYARPDRRNADKIGHTREETERLATPLPALSARGLYWSLSRAMINAGALISGGLLAGVRTGFDSGSTLDHVYRNKAEGFGPVGRIVDRIFLNAIGWRGIRERKAMLEELIPAAVARLKKAGRAVHLLDIAAGQGRYVLDGLDHCEDKPETVRLQDYSDINVIAGRQRIADRGLSTNVTFTHGDAFDYDALARLWPEPDLTVVSGLYELYSDNRLVALSLSGLAARMTPGSLLIYTNQPRHPQLEMIARCLTSHRDGRAWVMRRRTQQEMDQLVEAAGFRKLEQQIDRWGIFTVSVAERV